MSREGKNMETEGSVVALGRDGEEDRPQGHEEASAGVGTLYCLSCNRGYVTACKYQTPIKPYI